MFGVSVWGKSLKCSIWHRRTPAITKRRSPFRGCNTHYYDTHRLLHRESGTTLDHPEWEWAELDRKRMVWVSKGVLYAAKIHGKGLGEVKILHDFNDMEFKTIAAPY